MKAVSVAGLLPGAHGWPWPRLSLRAGPLPSERKDVRLRVVVAVEPVVDDYDGGCSSVPRNRESPDETVFSELWFFC